MATTYNSNEYANRVAVPPKANPKNKFGKVYRAYFSALTLAAGGAIGDVINACVLPKGARVVGGRCTWDAMTGGTQTLGIGVAGTAGKYYAVTAMGSSEGNIVFAEDITHNFGDELAAETTILLTNGTAAWTASKNIKGYVEFIF